MGGGRDPHGSAGDERAKAASRPLEILLLNQDWLKPELEQLGHHVKWAAYEKGGADCCVETIGTTIEDLLSRLSFSPDCLVWHDDSGPPWLFGLERLPVSSVLYSVDTHHHHRWHTHLAGLFDAVLVAQRDYLSIFGPLSTNIYWFPLWASRAIEPRAERELDVSFRGNLDPKWHPKRARFFEQFGALMPIDAQSGEFIETYARSKIVINEAVRGDLNFRVFEALMAGALLLTPRTGNGLLELFRDGEHLVTYPEGDAAEAAAKARYYLEHESERLEIARRGRAEILRSHTAAARAAQLEEILRTLSVREKPQRFLCAAHVLLWTIGAHRKISSPYLPLLLREAFGLLRAALEAGETFDADSVSLVVVCASYLEEAGFVELAGFLAHEAWRRFPNDLILRLAVIEALLREGAAEEAQRLACEVSDHADELLASAPRLLSEARQKIVGESRG